MRGVFVTIGLICVLAMMAFEANGEVPLPRPKPEPPKPEYLSVADARLMRAAFADIHRGRWNDARAKARQAKDPLGQKLVDWLYYREYGNTASFDEIAAFLEDSPDWPSRGLLYHRAEDRMPPNRRPQDVIAWFGDQHPRSGAGLRRLGEALLRVGETARGREMLREAWITGNFAAKDETTFLAAHGHLLSKSDAHERRLDRLLWQNNRGAARRQMKRVNAGWRRLAEARMALRVMSRGVDGAVNAVPASLQDNPGLIYERVRWRRRKGRHEQTWDLLANKAPKTVEEMVEPMMWWRERNAQIRRALRAGKPEIAYAIAAPHGLSDGEPFADAEFVAGWIALRFLDKPKQALAHFLHLQKNTSTPISQGRSYYWAARAAEDAGDKNLAAQYYAKSAQYVLTFYGQLAAEKVHGKDAYLQLPPESPREMKRVRNFEQREIIRVLRLLHDIREERWIRVINAHLAFRYDTAEELQALADLMIKLEYPHFSLRVGKVAFQRNFLLVERTYPVHQFDQIPNMKNAPEPAIVLGVSRQESEFNPRAISHAGAYGLMQLIPTTARITARKRGLPFRREWLTQRPGYNLALGQAHFSDLLERFSGSYIMSAAAYNAGAHRINGWIKEFGDPRRRHTDPIDWIEMIPFSETRNYVMRVMENTLIYRTLLAGQPYQIVLSQELKRGGIPDPKPKLKDAPPVAPAPKTQPGAAATKPLAAGPPPTTSVSAATRAEPSPNPVTVAPTVAVTKPVATMPEETAPRKARTSIPESSPPSAPLVVRRSAIAVAGPALGTASAAWPLSRSTPKAAREREPITPARLPVAPRPYAAAPAAPAATQVSAMTPSAAAELSTAWPRAFFSVPESNLVLGAESPRRASEMTPNTAGGAISFTPVTPTAPAQAEILSTPADSYEPGPLVAGLDLAWPLPQGCRRYVVQQTGAGVCTQ